MTPALLTAAILAVPSTGSPTPAEARKLATIFWSCAERIPAEAEIDAPLIAAVAWHESGFRPGAIRDPEDIDKPRMLGLMQLNESFIPLRMNASGNWTDPEANVREFCNKLERLWRHHRDHCNPSDHSLIAHHFAGYRVNPRAKRAAIEVHRRWMELVHLMHHFSGARADVSPQAPASG